MELVKIGWSIYLSIYRNTPDDPETNLSAQQLKISSSHSPLNHPSRVHNTAFVLYVLCFSLKYFGSYFDFCFRYSWSVFPLNCCSVTRYHLYQSTVSGLSWISSRCTFDHQHPNSPGELEWFERS
jgi:hypothetical protein